VVIVDVRQNDGIDFLCFDVAVFSIARKNTMVNVIKNAIGYNAFLRARVCVPASTAKSFANLILKSVIPSVISHQKHLYRSIGAALNVACPDETCPF